MVPEINIWAVLLATASSMAVGSVWYSRRVFGGYWMRTVGHDEESMRGNAVAPIVITVLVSFVTAWVLAGAIAITQNFYGGSFLANALLTALILWAGFTAARMVTHDVFDRRPAGLTVLNLAHELVTLEVMALIIGLIGINSL
ncbi:MULTISPECIES: DUF1761 domain-containing protein [Cryobacterium]|uniref:DUF1761 domain-containing protein n=1 Tax=Cryobacterium glucosi TaxID=1259175 RepID=A0ABY2ISX1_9MICO|nr:MULTISPECIES: DUF1761 domain-containing protein [Cryobacterium]MEB0002579.1 DUF1761 domain-containing protein [Cryobacterium sp. RTC2.1]TFB97405.1 DUF1761 domain-containing protein [Cryobacterium sp. MDB2-A-1]TFC02202.1 DUF1761 domain-containing protein [Cryobacterium sp. MDB2-33-2]TFC10007.1 DUF1761 domain-containing protein [Cryobacterium sp. MDB2-A-2]TFC17993.1 DUF1761 domain-containing protein [Cryobacterium sp. MDB2-10]